MRAVGNFRGFHDLRVSQRLEYDFLMTQRKFSKAQDPKKEGRIVGLCLKYEAIQLVMEACGLQYEPIVGSHDVLSAWDADQFLKKECVRELINETSDILSWRQECVTVG